MEYKLELHSIDVNIITYIFYFNDFNYKIDNLYTSIISSETRNLRKKS